MENYIGVPVHSIHLVFHLRRRIVFKGKYLMTARCSNFSIFMKHTRFTDTFVKQMRLLNAYLSWHFPFKFDITTNVLLLIFYVVCNSHARINLTEHNTTMFLSVITFENTVMYKSYRRANGKV